MALPKVLRITHSTDNTTIVNNDQIVTVKDIAINGILADLASARGQIGNAKKMPNLDFNTLITPGNYRVTGNPTNGPSLPLNISGASIGSLIVTGIPGQNGRIFQIMISDSTITYRTILTSTEETWSAWKQLFSGNKVGDGIRVTNGIISVPEYDGATASSSGTSGLVPPATAGQADYVLCGDGEWKDMLGMVAHAAGPSKKVISIPLTGTSTNYIAPETGYISYRVEPQDSNSWISLTIDGTSLYDVARPITANTNIALNLPISKGQKAILNCVENVTFTSRNAYFVYCNGNAPE